MIRSIVHTAQFLLFTSLFTESLSDEEDRLPMHMAPTNYNLTIVPNYDSSSFSFGGTVIIKMICKIGGSHNITLHAKHIKVTNYTLTDDKGNNIRIESLIEKKEDRQLVFNLTSILNDTSNYSLALEYHSTTRNKNGFISAVFDNPDTKMKENYYYTSMPPMNARTVFPCFDEPELKATFDLTLARKPIMTTLSNMPYKNICTNHSKYQSLVFDEFHTTPNMSTHVLGFYISTFSNKTAPNTSDVNFTMWAPNNLFGDDNVILQKVGGVYKQLEQFLNTTQPLKKQDLVYTGAYEHKGADSWGIINFAPEGMYIGNKSLPYFNEHNLISLAHKLSHQWFGNLVTPSWWNYLWLNEGPSTFMSYDVLQNQIDKIWDKFSYEIFQYTLKKDSKTNTVSMTEDFDLDDDDFYDIISTKGACLIKMMKKTFGEEVFKNGTQDYLKNFSFKNVGQDDLWMSIQKFVKDTNISVKDIMAGWTIQKHYPIVTVNVSEMCKNMLISQKLFLDKKPRKPVTEQFWKIPFTYQVISIGNDTVIENKLKYINETASTNISDILIMNNTLVIANVATNGFFRVNYDKDNWNKIIQLLRRNHTVVNVLNRAQFMDDAFSFVRPEIEEYTLGMNISTYLLKEKEELPWLTFFKYLLFFYMDIIQYNRNSTFMNYLKNVTKDIFKPFNLTELESETSGLTFDLRIKASKWACLSGNEACNDWAISAFDVWKNATEQGQLSKGFVNEYIVTIACSKLLNNTDNNTLSFVLEQLNKNIYIEPVISCVQKEDQIRLILNQRKKKLLSDIAIITHTYVGRGVIRNVLRNITTDRGELLNKEKIYHILTRSLGRSTNEAEFNVTSHVFEDIVNWPQVKGTKVKKFSLTAIQTHIMKEKEKWEIIKGIEDRVISVVLRP